MAVQMKQKATTQAVAVPETKEELAVLQEYDMNAPMTFDEKDLDLLTDQITLDDSSSIVAFGSEVAEKISEASDVVLNSMSMQQLNDSGKMLDALAEIMDQFNVKEIEEDPKGLKKLFTNAKKQLEKILDKYHNMGDSVEKIYVQLKQYEQEINQSNQKLDKMFQSNVEYYHDLVKYIAAGDKACEEVQKYIDEQKAEAAAHPENSELMFEIQNYEQGLDALKARVMDLRMAQNVAMQSVPMIKTIAYSNMHLVRKINSAFIVTLPVFKQALAQAMMLKRQKIQADSLKALDDRTNEMLLRNAQNTVEQSKLITQMAVNSSIKIETLEETWRTIVDGIDQTNQIRAEATQKIEEDKKRLENINKEFKERYALPNKR